jgi:ketosteroid isomerase-like protein
MTEAATNDFVERLRVGYESLSSGSVDEVLDLLDPALEIRDRPESPDASVYHGHAGARAAFQVSTDMFERLEMLPVEIFRDGDEIVVVLLMRAHGKESGVPVEERIAHHWTLREERAVRLQVYTDPEDALAAARIRG